jgi:mono/diheme cytochrome c family protein
LRTSTLLAALLAGAGLAGEAGADPAALFGEHCASCHGDDRLGGTGPALLPENLGRLKREHAAQVIASGRAQTQMPAFGDRLGEADVAGLVELIYTPLAEVPEWGAAEIEASRTVMVAPTALAESPRHDADPLNLPCLCRTV